MNVSMIKNTLRKVWKTKGRFLAITAIIAIGSGFFTGVKVTSPSMKATAEKYYSDTNLMDFRFVSTLGFDDSDIENIRKLDGITDISAGYTADLFYNQSGESDAVVRVYSYDENALINKPSLVEGKMPEAADECVIDSELSEYYPIGSTIVLSTNSSEKTISDYLKTEEFKVVGTVNWSMYIDFERGSTTLGSGKVSAYMLVEDEAFALEAYTVVYAKCAEFDGVDPFGDEYSELLEQKTGYFEEQIKLLADEKAQRIYNESMNDAELVKSIADYEKGLSDYNTAYSEYETTLSELQAYIDETTEQIGEYTVMIEAAAADYDEKSAEYNTAAAELEKSEEELTAREEQANLDEQLADSQESAIDALQLTVMDYYFKSAQEPYPDSLVSALENAEILDTGAVSVSKALENYVTASPDGSEKVSAKSDLDDILDLKEKSIERERERIEAERSDINSQRLENEATASILAENKAELDAQKLEIDTNQATLDEYTYQVSAAKAEAEAAQTEADALFGEQKAQLDTAKAEIDKAVSEIEEVSNSVEWYCFDRTSNTGYTDFGTNADRVDSIARVFPIFFILVAILVCLTTMARMIEEERVEIGTLKALGYSRGAIFAQYICYAAVASVIGVTIGLLIGVNTIPRAIYMAYMMMYILPEMILEFPIAYIVGCVLVALLCTGLSAYFACAHSLKEEPARLMRPKSPKNGKRVLLERISFIWQRLGFNAKVTARNVFRYKSRVWMTVLGICGCTALLLTGFTLKYAISAIVDLQYGEIFKYDVLCYYNEEADISEHLQILDENPDVSQYTCALQKSYEISANSQSYDGYVIVPDDANALKSFISVRDAKSGAQINITGAGAVINEKLALLLDVKVGDEISMGDRKTKVKVSAIAENYTFNYIYMSKSLYTTLFGDFENNVTFATLSDSCDTDALSGELLATQGMLSVSYTKDSGKSFRELVDTLNYIVFVIIAASGALAFVVLYNLNNINIVERQRELATLKVLGFFDNEVSAYVYRETTITALLGILAGLFVGTFLAKFVVTTSEVDVVMFAHDIPLYCYLLAAAVTVAFVVLVDLIMHNKLKKIDMASSMKAIE